MNPPPDNDDLPRIHESSDAHPNRAPRRRWLRRLAAGAAVAVGIAGVALAVLWFGGRPGVPDHQVRYVRDASGKLVPQRDAESGGPLLEVQAGTIQAQNNLTTVTSESRSNSRFACRRLAIFNRSDHPLLARTGPLLAERLGKLAYVEAIDYYPFGQRPAEGERAPDLIVTIDLASLEESSALVHRELEATVLVTAGDCLARSSHFYQDGSSPLVQMHLRSRLSHRSTTTGVESGAARYKLVAENIAQQIGDQLAKEFDENKQADGQLPALPEGFYPAYEPPPPLPILEGRKAELLTAFHGLLTPTDAIWTFGIAGDLAAALTAMAEQLEEAGWKRSSLATSGSPYLRMTRDGAVLEVFPPERDAEEAAAAPPDAPRALYIHYTRKMREEKVGELLAAMAAGDADLETLLLFRSHWPQEVENAVFQRLENGPLGEADDWLLLAEMRQARDRTDAARDAVRKAQLLAEVLPDPGEIQSRIKSMQKKLGGPEPPAKGEPPDPALLDELGFVPIPADGTAPPPVPVAVGRPALFQGTDSDGAWKLVALRLRFEGKEPRIQPTEVGPGRRSWGSGSSGHGTRFGDRRYSFRLEGDRESGYTIVTSVEDVAPSDDDR